MYNTYEGVLAYTVHETGKHEPISTDSLNLGVVCGYQLDNRLNIQLAVVNSIN